MLGWLLCAGALLLADPSEKWRLFFALLGIMLPYMALICMTALLGAALNTSARFFAPAIAPALLNIIWIAAVWLFHERFGVYAMAWGVLVAGAAQLALQLPFLRRAGWSIRPLWDWAHPGLRRILRLMLPVVLGLGVIQVNVLLDQLIAKFCVPGSGANSALFYGNRLIQFPLGVLGLALATAVFPSLARRAASADHRGLVDTANMALRTALFIALPCAAVTLALAAPIVRVVYERGAFDAESTMRTARVLFYYGSGLWAFCGIHVLVRAFHAMEDMRTPVKVGAAMVGLNLALNLTLVWFMREAGLALSSSVTAAVNLLVLGWLLRRRLGRLGGPLGGGGHCQMHGSKRRGRGGGPFCARGCRRASVWVCRPLHRHGSWRWAPSSARPGFCARANWTSSCAPCGDAARGMSPREAGHVAWARPTSGLASLRRRGLRRSAGGVSRRRVRSHRRRQKRPPRRCQSQAFGLSTTSRYRSLINSRRLFRLAPSRATLLGVMATSPCNK